MNRRGIIALSAASLLCVGLPAPAYAAASEPPPAADAVGVPPQQPGTNRIVSTRANGTPAQSGGGAGALSADGRYLAFVSTDPKLLPGRSIPGLQVYVRDLVTGATRLVSGAGSGVPGNGPSRDPDISADGGRIVFTSTATNLVPTDVVDRSDIYAFDAASGVVRLISGTPSGEPGNAPSTAPAISADGLHVVYESTATNLAPNDEHFAGTSNIFEFDAPANRTVLISHAADGGDTDGFDSRAPDVSGDGARVVFDSLAHNLTGRSDPNPYEDVFVVDRTTGRTDQVTLTRFGHSVGAAISADGRHLAFSSRGTSFTGEPTAPGEVDNVWTFDLEPRTFVLVTRGLDGEPANKSSYLPDVSADGRVVTFTSDATNLSGGDLNGSTDVFAWGADTTRSLLLSRGVDGRSGNGSSYVSAASADGAYVAYTSAASNLDRRDANRVSDAVVYRLD